MTVEGFWVSPTQESTWEASKGRGVSDCVVWRKRRGEMVGEPGAKQMGGAKEIEVPTLAREPLPSKGTRQVGPIRKGWTREIPLKDGSVVGFGEADKAVPIF